MAKDISKKTIMILTIIVVVISVFSITLNIVTMNKEAEVRSQGIASGPSTSGVISVEVPPQPSESGAQISLDVIEKI